MGKSPVVLFTDNEANLSYRLIAAEYSLKEKFVFHVFRHPHLDIQKTYGIGYKKGIQKLP